MEHGIEKLEELAMNFQTNRKHEFAEIFYFISLCLEVFSSSSQSRTSEVSLGHQIKTNYLFLT